MSTSIRRFALLIATLAVALSACSSGWSEAELNSVTYYCEASADQHRDSCASWIDGIHRLSNCDVEQAKRVIDRVIAEYNGAPASSVAENYLAVGCEYGAR